LVEMYELVAHVHGLAKSRPGYLAH